MVFKILKPITNNQCSQRFLEVSGSFGLVTREGSKVKSKGSLSLLTATGSVVLSSSGVYFENRNFQDSCFVSFVRFQWGAYHPNLTMCYFSASVSKATFPFNPGLSRNLEWVSSYLRPLQTPRAQREFPRGEDSLAQIEESSRWEKKLLFIAKHHWGWCSFAELSLLCNRSFKPPVLCHL